MGDERSIPLRRSIVGLVAEARRILRFANAHEDFGGEHDLHPFWRGSWIDAQQEELTMILGLALAVCAAAFLAGIRFA